MKVCVRCGVEFRRNNQLKQHLHRKISCEAHILDIDCETLLNDFSTRYEIYVEEYKQKKKEMMHIGTNSPKFLCRYCDKEYNHRSSLSYHELHSCKKKYSNTDVQQLIISMANKMNRMEEELSHLRSNKTIINNSGINNGTINNNINNNININNFGSEVNKFTTNDVESLFGFGYDMVLELIKRVHIDTPENRNIYIPSLKNKYAYILKDKKWLPILRVELMHKLVDKKQHMISDFIEGYGNDFKKIKKEEASRRYNNYLNCDDEPLRTMEDATIMFLENRHLINPRYKYYQDKMIIPPL